MIIGLTGAAGSGKNTVADMLCEMAFFTQMGFADPLYSMVSAMTGLPETILRDRAVKEATIEWLGKSPRELLQSLGTEWGRGMLGDHVWVTAGMRRAMDFVHAGRGVAITDCRFDNEAEAVREAGGVVWQVLRPDGGVRGPAMAHESERGLSYHLVSRTIVNDGDLAVLRGRVEGALEEELTRQTA